MLWVRGLAHKKLRSEVKRMTEIIFCFLMSTLHPASSTYQKYKKLMEGNQILNSRTKPAGFDFYYILI